MGNKIREVRKARQLTLKQLAERVGTSDRQISLLERGQRGLSPEWMERIAAALDCRPVDLLFAEDDVLDERERAFLDKYRTLSDEQKEAALVLLASMAMQSGSTKK